MKKLFILVLAFALVVSACAPMHGPERSSGTAVVAGEGASPSQEQVDEMVEYAESCPADVYTQVDAYYFPIFARDNSPKECRPAKDHPCRNDMCYTKYMRYSIWKKDAQLCEKLDHPSEGFHRDKCFYELSFFKLDRAICEKISNEQLNAACRMDAEGTDANGLDRAAYYAGTWFGRCSYDPTQDYEHDLEKIPPKTDEEEAECQLQVLEYLQNNYKKQCDDDFCSYFKAFEKDNLAWCGSFPDSKMECITMMVYGGAASAEDCGKLSGSYSTSCTAMLAVKNNDLELCKSLGWDSSECLDELAVKRKDVEVCFETDDSFSREMCVEHYASELGDASACGHPDYPGDVSFCKSLAD